MSARAPHRAAWALALLASCAQGQIDDAITLRDAQPDVDDAQEKPDDAQPDVVSPDVVLPDVVLPDVLTVDASIDVVDARAADAARDITESVEAPAPPDAGPLGDSLPTGAVMFFTGASCPGGWSPFDDAAGRAIAATTGDSGAGATRGAPLTDGEDRAHTHDLTARFTLPAVSYVGIVGPANNGVGAAGDVVLRGATGAASSGLPYVQLLVCRKDASATPGSITLPRGMTVFFAASRCPSGFSQPADTQGRVLVGLPAGGTQGATFGGAPIVPGDPTTHAHDASLTLTTTPHGIALASGCCGGGFARDGTVTATATTDRAEPAVPTVLLLHCQKD